MATETEECVQVTNIEFVATENDYDPTYFNPTYCYGLLSDYG